MEKIILCQKFCSKIWLLTLALAFLSPIFIIAAVIYYTPFPYKPINFMTLSANNIIPVTFLNDADRVKIKTDYIENYTPPEIGLFGLHNVHYATELDFSQGRFFNFYFEHSSLEDIYIYLNHLDNIGKLPTKLIIVNIPNPFVGNGGNYLGRQYFMPKELYVKFDEELGFSVISKFNYISAKIRDFMDWRELYYRLKRSVIKYEIEQSRAEQSRAEQSRAEQSRAEQSRKF